MESQPRCHTQLTHSLSLSHSLSSSSLSLHSLTHSNKEKEGKEKERRGRFGVAAADGGHGDHLEALIHKR
jgi:hypothetical protein